MEVPHFPFQEEIERGSQSWFCMFYFQLFYGRGSWNVVTNLIMYYIALLLSCFSSFQFLNRQGFFQDESLSRIQLWRIPEVNRTWVNHPNWKKENHRNQTFMLGFHVRFPGGGVTPPHKKKKNVGPQFILLTFFNESVEGTQLMCVLPFTMLVPRCTWSTCRSNRGYFPP